MASLNYAERTHTSVTMEVGFGEFSAYGGRLGVNVDNQTGDVSFTGCVSGGVTLIGESFGAVSYDTDAAGGVTDSATTSSGVSANEFAGAGPLAAQGSYDLINAKLDANYGLGTTSGVFGTGLGYDIKASFCIEINASRHLPGLDEFLHRVLDRLGEPTNPREGKDSSFFDREYHPFQAREHEYHLLEPDRYEKTSDYHLLDPDKYDYGKQLKEGSTNLGELSKEPVVKEDEE